MDMILKYKQQYDVSTQDQIQQDQEFDIATSQSQYTLRNPENIHQLELDNIDLNQQVLSLNKQIKRLEKKDAENQQTVQKLQIKIDSLNEEKIDLKNQIAETQTQLDRVCEEMNTQTNKQISSIMDKQVLSSDASTQAEETFTSEFMMKNVQLKAVIKNLEDKLQSQKEYYEQQIIQLQKQILEQQKQNQILRQEQVNNILDLSVTKPNLN